MAETTRQESTNSPTSAHSAEPLSCTERGVIAVRLREVRQLFDALDPSPFREKDLDPNAEDYIVESAKELPSREPCCLVIHLDQPTGLLDVEQAIGDAVRVHFARRSQVLRRDLHRLFHRGFISLGIGLAFLVLVIVVVRVIVQLLGESTVGILSKEGLVILGWVAMWRPLEIFLYDWWPILGKQRVYDRLSRIDVRVVPGGARDRDELARVLIAAGTDPRDSKPTAQGPARQPA